MAVSRSVVYGSLAAIVLGAVWWLGQEPEVIPTKAKKKQVVNTVKEISYFDQADHSAHFAKPKSKLRNVFLPLVVVEKNEPAVTEAEEKDLLKVPGDLADGDANWAYTGFVIVDRKRMALLENSASKKGDYLVEGGRWKTAKVTRITAESITFTKEEGVNTVVLRYNPNLAKKAAPAAASPKPLDVSAALRGPIGPQNLRIVPSPPPAGMPAGVVIQE